MGDMLSRRNREHQKVTILSMAPRHCLLIADDLTGACDSAVHFALRGHRAAAAVSMCCREIDAAVIAISTETRDCDAEQIAARIVQAAHLWSDELPRILFKKIDSTLRGRVGSEIRAAMEAFACGTAIVTPAFPAMGRVVRNGRLSVTGDPEFAEIDIAGRLRSEGLDPRAAGASRVVIADAECDRDLDLIVARAGSAGRVLWAGSAGLASALARAFPAGPRVSHEEPGPARRVVFCIGSDHKVTLAQQRSLADVRPLEEISAEHAAPGAVTSALDRGAHVLLQVPRGRVSSTRLRELLAASAGAALLLCGGDTAAAVCRAGGAEWIELIDEIVPGLPRGILHGGGLHGVPVATKSGGFGQPGALIQVADFFSCPNNQTKDQPLP